jgi:hypothetical protein
MEIYLHQSVRASESQLGRASSSESVLIEMADPRIVAINARRYYFMMFNACAKKKTFLLLSNVRHESMTCEYGLLA